MQQLLTGQTRLPGFHGEWEVKRLGDIGEITSAGVDKKIRPDEVPVRLVNYLDVYRRDFIYSKDLNHWVTALPQQAKRCAVQKGDVFFTPTSETRDDIGISSVAMEDIPDAAYSYHVARLRLREAWDLCFRTYAFKTRAFLDQAETLCTRIRSLGGRRNLCGAPARSGPTFRCDRNRPVGLVALNRSRQWRRPCNPTSSCKAFPSGPRVTRTLDPLIKSQLL